MVVRRMPIPRSCRQVVWHMRLRRLGYSTSVWASAAKSYEFGRASQATTLRISGHARAVCGTAGRTAVAGVSEVGGWWGRFWGTVAFCTRGPGNKENQELKITKIYYLFRYLASMFEPLPGHGPGASLTGYTVGPLRSLPAGEVPHPVCRVA